jgi:HD-GYP domain-containing protein (c-di-GMP phosphodiesterase class II)
LSKRSQQSPAPSRAAGQGEPRPTRTRRRGRILWSLLAVLAFVGLAPLGSVAWKLIATNREALTTAHQEYQLLLARSIAREADTHVEGLRTQLVRVAQALGAASHRRSSARAEIQRILDDVVDDRLVFLRFTDLKGRTVDSRSERSLSPLLGPLFDDGLRKVAELMQENPGHRPEDAGLSQPFLLQGNRRRAALVGSAPVVSSGRFRGVLSALVDMQSVWDDVVERDSSGHEIFALDTSGMLFASSDALELGHGEVPRGSALVDRFLASELVASETLPFVLERNGIDERYLGSYYVTGQGWGVFVQARQDQIYHSVRAMVQSTSSWAVAALALAVIAAVFFARTLSTPVGRLAAASRAFAAGDFSARVQVRASNEIGELAETFNGMAGEIESYIRRLTRAAEENNELFLGTIRALAQAIDAKDPYTRGHSVRVNKYSVIIARYLGLPKPEIRDIHVASLLHDVGKIGIDDRILKKPGVLTDEEFEVMKTHTTLGESIMAPIPKMKKILPGLRSHHERWDGSGYPDGLGTDDIPKMARIIAVADCFDAMTTNRPYQKKMSFPDAVARINQIKGVGLDERVVEMFNRAYQAGEFSREEAEIRAEDEVHARNEVGKAV